MANKRILKICKVIILFSSVIFLLLVSLLIRFLSNIGKDVERLFSEDGLVIKTFSDSNGLIVLGIQEKNKMFLMNTRASRYSRFDLNILTKGKFVFLSSDIGNYLYIKQKGKWNRYDVNIFLSPNKSLVAYLARLETSQLYSDNISSRYGLIIYSTQRKKIIFSKEFSTKLSTPPLKWQSETLIILKKIPPEKIYLETVTQEKSSAPDGKRTNDKHELQ